MITTIGPKLAGLLAKLKTVTNDPAKAGQLAARKVTFGDYRRYAVAPIHTRFDAVQWFVWDVEHDDSVYGAPVIIRQSDTLEAAMEGLLGARD